MGAAFSAAGGAGGLSATLSVTAATGPGSSFAGNSMRTAPTPANRLSAAVAPTTSCFLVNRARKPAAAGAAPGTGGTPTAAAAAVTTAVVSGLGGSTFGAGVGVGDGAGGRPVTPSGTEREYDGLAGTSTAMGSVIRDLSCVSRLN